MVAPPPALIVDRFSLLDSPAHRRIRRALLATLRGAMHESFWFAEAPVLHYPLPLAPWSRGEVNEVIPSLCAWDRYIFPDEPGAGPLRVVPTWVCEVDDTQETDAKLALHSRAGVRRAWLVDPATRSFYAYALGPGGQFQLTAAEDSPAELRLQPFETISIPTAAFWEP
jgi:hypothetical protein